VKQWRKRQVKKERADRTESAPPSGNPHEYRIDSRSRKKNAKEC
jgi:hypothetical protein